MDVAHNRRILRPGAGKQDVVKALDTSPDFLGPDQATTSGAALPSLQSGGWLNTISGLRARLRSGVLLENLFLLGVTLAVAVSLFTLGVTLERRTRLGLMYGMSRTSALYLEGFLAPHVQTLNTDQALTTADRTGLERVLDSSMLRASVAIIKIWGIDGNLLFSSDQTKNSAKLDGYHLDSLKAGQIVVDNRTKNHPQTAIRGGPEHRLIEIYIPIYSMKTSSIIAFGGFYEYNDRLHGQLDRESRFIWISIFIAFLLIILFLHFSVRKTSGIIGKQHKSLQENIVRSGAMLRKHSSLRREANDARLAAVRFKETYLASVGADIHDGPIQILGLMMLKLPRPMSMDQPSVSKDDAIAACRDLEPLIKQAMHELRNISTGLILPEIETLSAIETINLALDHHEHSTGTHVERDIGSLPADIPAVLLICVYRILQEALANAYKHAGGIGQHVRVRVLDEQLEIVVSDAGTGASPHTGDFSEHSKLGLKGMQIRVRSLRGRMSIHRLASGGTAVEVRLPLFP